MTIARMLIAVLLATHIGAAVGDQASRSSADCQGALRLENMRLRHRLAQTKRALASVSREADACAAEAKQCSELRRAFVDLTHLSENLRQTNSRLRWSARGIRAAHPPDVAWLREGNGHHASAAEEGIRPFCSVVCVPVSPPPWSLDSRRAGMLHRCALCRPKATDIAARIGALDHKQAAVAIDGRCTPHVVADFDFRATVGIFL